MFRGQLQVKMKNLLVRLFIVMLLLSVGQTPYSHGILKVKYVLLTSYHPITETRSRP